MQSNGLETFEHFKARVSLPPPPPPPPPLSPQSGKMSLYPKWAGVPARPTGAKIKTGFEILRPAGDPWPGPELEGQPV